MIADMINNKNLDLIVTALFIRGISVVFVTQSYFKVPEDVRWMFYTLFYHENS